MYFGSFHFYSMLWVLRNCYSHIKHVSSYYLLRSLSGQFHSHTLHINTIFDDQWNLLYTISCKLAQLTWATFWQLMQTFHSPDGTPASTRKWICNILPDLYFTFMDTAYGIYPTKGVMLISVGRGWNCLCLSHIPQYWCTEKYVIQGILQSLRQLVFTTYGF